MDVSQNRCERMHILTIKKEGGTNEEDTDKFYINNSNFYIMQL